MSGEHGGVGWYLSSIWKQQSRVPHLHSYEHPMTKDPPTRTHMLNAPALFKIITLDNFTTLTFKEVQYSNHTIHEGDLKIAT